MGLFRKKVNEEVIEINQEESFNGEIIISPITISYGGFKTTVNGKELEFAITNQYFDSFEIFITKFDNKRISTFISLKEYGNTIEESFKKAIIQYISQSRDFTNKLGL